MTALLLLLVLACCVVASAVRLPVLAAAAPRSGDGRRSGRLTDKQLRVINFLSGGVAGTVAATTTLPLEVVKTQLQSSRLGNRSPVEMAKLIFEREGALGFFKGLQPMLIGIIPTRAIYFWSYGETKNVLRPRLGDSPLNHLLSAFSAGITSNTIMNPWWMVKTRFQILADQSVGQVQFKSYGALVKHIYRQEGLGGFYKGVVASYVGCIEGAIQWMCYENLKARLQGNADRRSENAHKSNPRAARAMGGRGGGGGAGGGSSGGSGVSALPSKRGEISAAEYFIAAGFSKAVAILASYPHEVVRTRMREQATNGVFRYNGFAGTLNTIAREEGLRGLYSGMGIHLARSVPNAALMFLSFELISKALAAYAADSDGTGQLGQAGAGAGAGRGRGRGLGGVVGGVFGGGGRGSGGGAGNSASVRRGRAGQARAGVL